MYFRQKMIMIPVMLISLTFTELASLVNSADSLSAEQFARQLKLLSAAVTHAPIDAEQSTNARHGVRRYNDPRRPSPEKHFSDQQSSADQLSSADGAFISKSELIQRLQHRAQSRGIAWTAAESGIKIGPASPNSDYDRTLVAYRNWKSRPYSIGEDDDAIFNAKHWLSHYLQWLRERGAMPERRADQNRRSTRAKRKKATSTEISDEDDLEFRSSSKSKYDDENEDGQDTRRKLLNRIFRELDRAIQKAELTRRTENEDEYVEETNNGYATVRVDSDYAVRKLDSIEETSSDGRGDHGEWSRD